jgi:lipase chaperone LimK
MSHDALARAQGAFDHIFALFEQQITAVRQDAGLSSMQRAAAVEMLCQRQLAEAMRARARSLRGAIPPQGRAEE